jgi:ferrous iron transport protein A
MALKDLTQLKAGSRGLVVSLEGGHGMKKRLESLGIRPGVHVTKVSNQFMRGPVIVRIGNTQVAIGFGMARRVMIDDAREDEKTS